MTVIEQLKHHENDQLSEWIDLDEKFNKIFLKEVVQFAKENPTEIQQYCVNTIPREFSSLSIVYQALSEYSTDWHAFLFKEIERVIMLAKGKTIKADYMEVLTDIEIETIYSKDEGVYIQILDFITSQLQSSADKNFTIQLLDVMDWFLTELDEGDAILESQNWVNQLKRLANDGPTSVKLKAREVLEDNEFDVALNPLSTMDKLKGIFK